MCFVFFLFICVPRREPYFPDRSDEAIMNDASSIMYSITVHMKISGDRSSGCDSSTKEKDLHCCYCLIEACLVLVIVLLLYNTL